MAIGRTFKESLQKYLSSLETRWPSASPPRPGGDGKTRAHLQTTF